MFKTKFQNLHNFSLTTNLLVPKERNTNMAVQQYLGVDFCFPSSCSAKDFRRAVSEFIGQEIIFSDPDELNELRHYSIVTYADEGWCYTRESVENDPHFDTPDIVIMYL